MILIIVTHRNSLNNMQHDLYGAFSSVRAT